MRAAVSIRALLAFALVGTVAAGGQQLIQAPRAEAATLVQDPDRNINTVAGWIYYYRQTPAQVTSRLGTSFRLIDLEVTGLTSDGLPHMTMVAVRNTGAYARSGWDWRTGLTASGIASTLGTTNRLIDLERYATPAGVRYAIVYVPNSGAQQKTQGYFLGKTAAQVSSLLTAQGARLIDMEVFASGTSNLVNGIWIKNAGADARTWHYYYAQTPSSIATKLSGTGERILTMERRANGTIDLITVKDGAGWWYYLGQSASSVANRHSQLGTRLSRLEPVGNGTYDIVMLENLPAETKRVRDLALSKMGPYSWGFYVKRVGGGMVHGLQPDKVFEPASAIKVLHHLVELRRLAASNSDTETLGSRMDFWRNPDRRAETEGDGPNTCPDYPEDDSNVVRTSVRQALYGMMWDSDNRLTRAFTRRHGMSALNSYADSLGMTRTQLRQDRIGCGWRGDLKNDTTLRDLGKLYEQASNGSAISSAVKRDFVDLMINQGNGSFLSKVIDEEGVRLGKSAAVVAEFKSKVLYYGKGGSYGTCPTPQATAPCNPPIIDIATDAGVVSLPLKAGGTADYVFGRFMQGTVKCSFSNPPCSTIQTAQQGLGSVRAEMFRSSVRSILSGW